MLLLSSSRAQWGHGCSQIPMRDFPLQAVTYSHKRKLNQLLSGIISASARHTKAWLPFEFFEFFFFFKEGPWTQNSATCYRGELHGSLRQVTVGNTKVTIHSCISRAWQPPILLFLIINTKLLTGERGEQARTTQRHSYYPEDRDQKLPRTQMRLYSKQAPGTGTAHQPAGKPRGSPHQEVF